MVKTKNYQIVVKVFGSAMPFRGGNFKCSSEISIGRNKGLQMRQGLYVENRSEHRHAKSRRESSSEGVVSLPLEEVAQCQSNLKGISENNGMLTRY